MSGLDPARTHAPSGQTRAASSVAQGRAARRRCRRPLRVSASRSGLALDDRPVPGGTQTFVRTLEPLPQTPP